MTILQHDKKFYELRNLGNGFIGHVPSSVTIIDGAPAMRWSGSKIPQAVWREIVGFFQWSQEETKSETQVRLLLNADTGEFKAWAFPQKYGTGMTAKELSDHADYERQLNEQMAGGNWIKFGTVHHHCSVGAFQSGTDSSDETEMGIHITLGNIGSPRHSIHGRVSLTIPGTLAPDGALATKASHAYYPAVFSDWFDSPEMPIPLSENLREEITKHILCTPVEKPEFPPAWAENLIKDIPLAIAANAPLGHWKSQNPTTLEYYDDEYRIRDAEEYHNRARYYNSYPTANLDQADIIVEEVMKKEGLTQAMLYGMIVADPHLLTKDEQDVIDSLQEQLDKVGATYQDYLENCGYVV
jgi:hypothetical protein